MTSFGESSEFSLGIEEELQIVDPETGELVSRVDEFIGEVKHIESNLRKELFQSIIEIASDVCEDIDEARENVKRLRGELFDYCEDKGYELMASGTHPFANWDEQDITEGERYQEFVDKLRWTAKRELIFGQHVHIGVASKEEAIFCTNKIKKYLPHLLALSVNSPFWQGEETGLKSTRIRIFDNLPRTGLPKEFEDWKDYKKVENRLKKGGSIDDITMIWWDVRPRPDLGTIEIRISDLPTTLDESISIAAITQALTYRLSKIYKEEREDLYPKVDQEIIKENRWRALRDGLEGKFIKRENNEIKEVDVADEINNLLDQISTEISELGIKKEAKKIREMNNKRYTGAKRQLEINERTNDLSEVVKELIELTQP
ncbi:MAG: Glutamate-cysteine ligase family 2 GCS2 [Candidatus Methanohalarchaeum thermophilum]|uniref:Glutamate--cysteine ligase n=1 Tax=Methanohalarchaeum thermophilum TaxID=1903181 RepID=A0A1Q6DXV7_METT1|nr:MAG: Glutamate-cysteine ligase family 2 GCS2 [Candidatus Methanohalarchaeum thermophilum]